MQPGTKEAVYPLDVGEVVISWPDSISPEEIADVEGWMQLMIRKLKRSAQATDDVKRGTFCPTKEDKEA